VAQDISNLQHEREARAEAESANQTLRALLADTEAIVAEKEAIIAAQHRDIVKMRHHTRVDVRVRLTSSSVVCVNFPSEKDCLYLEEPLKRRMLRQ